MGDLNLAETQKKKKPCSINKSREIEQLICNASGKKKSSYARRAKRGRPIRPPLPLARRPNQAEPTPPVLFSSPGFRCWIPYSCPIHPSFSPFLVGSHHLLTCPRRLLVGPPAHDAIIKNRHSPSPSPPAKIEILGPFRGSRGGGIVVVEVGHLGTKRGARRRR